MSQQTFTQTEHGPGVEIHWTLLRGDKIKIVAATIGRPNTQQPKGLKCQTKSQKAGPPKN